MPFEGARQGAPSPIIGIVEDRQGADAVIRCRGEIDLANARFVREAIERAFGGDAERVLVDLSGVEFIDSTGLAALAELATLNGGRLLFLQPSQQVRRMVQLSGLVGHLKFLG